MQGPGAEQRMMDAAENASPVDAVAAVTDELAGALAATAIAFLIADMSGRALVRLTHGSGGSGSPDAASGAGDLRAQAAAAGLVDQHDRRTDAREAATVLPFDGGPREQVIRSQRVQVLPPEDADVQPGWTVLAPVTQRGEPLGLLEAVLPEEPAADAVDAVARAAHLLGYVVIANRRHTDLFEWGQRTIPFTLSAEIQRRLLPPAFTCEAASFTLSAWLEPASSVGGDTFDYSLARDVLHVSMTDAMGHGTISALGATLCVGALRSARRTGATLLEQVAVANTALVEHAAGAGTESFVTGLLGRVDLTSGTLSMVNAGHVAPYLVREGHVTTVDLPAGLPLGLFGDAEYGITAIGLEPGDRVVLVTDGMVERNAAGFALSTGIEETRDLHPREAVRFLADRVLEATGNRLADDAALLILDWHGGHAGERSATGGSELDRASSGS